MLRLIKIFFNACLIVLAIIGFNAIGGQKYVETAKLKITSLIEEYMAESVKKIGDFSNLNEEFQIDNTVNLIGYKAVLAEHKASGQKMAVVDSGKKSLLTQEDIESENIEIKLKDLAEQFQVVAIDEIKVTNRGTMNAFGQDVPYAKFEAHVSKLPFSDISGIVSSIKTSDGSEKLAISVSEKKKYSQLITNEFFKGVQE